MTRASVSQRLRAALMVVVSGAAALTAAQTSSTAQEAAAPRAAYARAIDRVERLRHLQSLVSTFKTALDGTMRASNVLKEELRESQQQIVRATRGVASTAACLSTFSQGLRAGVETAERYRRSARESLNKTADFSNAPTTDAPTRLMEAEPVFRQRFAEKQALMDRVDATIRQKNSCAPQIPQSDDEVDRTARAFVRVTIATRALANAVDVLDRLTGQIADEAGVARARGWLTLDAGAVTFPPTPGLTLLRERVDAFDGFARLKLADPHPGAAGDLSDYRDAVLRAAVEEDAYRFLTLLARSAAASCSADQCSSLLERAGVQGVRAAFSNERAERELRRVRQSLQENPGLGALAPAPAMWMDAQRSIGEAAARAADDVTALAVFAGSLGEAVSAPVASALERALVERRAAYRRIFGVPEPEDVQPLPLPPTAAPPQPPPPPPPLAPPPRRIARNAFELLVLRGKESPGYGAYTYVIFPLRERRIEYEALLAAIVRLTPAADPLAPAAEKRTTNLFEIPGISPVPIEADQSPAYASRIDNYDWGRALSLVQTALDGVLTSSRVLSQFQRSPGPFLLTVPVPLEQAKGTTPLLLADLSGYAAAGYVDLVRSYQIDLVAAFPTTQTVWQPPWNQQFALALLNIGVRVTGQNFVAVRAP